MGFVYRTLANYEPLVYIALAIGGLFAFRRMWRSWREWRDSVWQDADFATFKRQIHFQIVHQMLWLLDSVRRWLPEGDPDIAMAQLHLEEFKLGSLLDAKLAGELLFLW